MVYESARGRHGGCGGDDAGGRLGDLFADVALATLYDDVLSFGDGVCRGDDVCCFAASVLRAWRNQRFRRCLADIRWEWGSARARAG